MSDPRLLLIDILQRARRIERYATKGREEFETSELIQDAVLRNLEVIGEAAKGIGEDDRARWPQVPWRRMAGLRDVLIHAYQDVDLDAIWRVTQRDIPELASSVSDILRELGIDPQSIP